MAQQMDPEELAGKDLESRVINLASYIKLMGGFADSTAAAPNQDDFEILDYRRAQFDAIPDKTPSAVFNDLISLADGVINTAFKKTVTIDKLLPGDKPDLNKVVNFCIMDLCFHLEFLQKHDEESYQNALTYLINEVNSNQDEYMRQSLTAPGQGIHVFSEAFTKLSENLLPSVTIHALPTQFISTTDNVSNTTFNDAEEKHALITRKGAKYTTDVNTGRSYRTSLSIDFDAWSEDDIQIANGKTLGVYERAVHDAVCTLYQDGNMEYITPTMIYRIMSGRDASKLTAKQVNDILNALRKLIRTFVTIKERTIKQADTVGLSIESSLLDGEIVEVQLYGKRATVLRVKSEPVLLGYASNKNQITRADLQLFSIEGIKGYSQDTLLLVQVLWHRITIMMSKSKSGINRTILFSSLYRQLELDSRYSGASLYNKRAWVRKNANIILTYWKKLHFIADFEPQRDGQEYIGYIITIMNGTLLEAPVDR